MGRGGVHRMRPAPVATTIEIMKLIHRYAELIGVAADVVQREQAIVHVQRRILESLGHQRPGELLESHREVDPIAFFFFGSMIAEFEQQKSFDKIYLEQQTGIGRFGALDGNAKPTPVLCGVCVTADITAVHREKRQHFHQCSLESVKGDVGGMAVAAGNVLQQEREPFYVAGHVFADNQPLLLYHERGRGRIHSGKALIDLAEVSALLTGAENSVYEI